MNVLKSNMRRTSSAFLLCASTVIAFIAGSASAQAAPAGIGTSSAFVVGVEATITVWGSASGPSTVWATAKPAAGASCASSFVTDTGVPLGSQPVTGAYGAAVAYTPSDTGTYLVCVWESPTSDEVTQPVSLMAAARPPAVTLSIGVAPYRVVVGTPVTLTVRASSEASRLLYATLRAGGGSPQCPATYQQDTKVERGYAFTGELGPRSYTISTAGLAVGTWTVCTWIGESPSAAPAYVAAREIRVTRPARCTVPVTRGLTLALAKRRLIAAGCSVGSIRRVHSTAVPRARVLRTAPAAGTRLALDSKVAIVLST